MKWKDLDSISSAPVIKQSYLIVIIMPMLASIVSMTNMPFSEQVNIITIVFSDIKTNIQISFPVNKFFLYIASLLFFIGRLTTYLMEPKFIKDFENYFAFQTLKQTASDIARYVKDDKLRLEIVSLNDKKDKFHKCYDHFNIASERIRIFISIVFIGGGIISIGLIVEGAILIFKATFL